MNKVCTKCELEKDIEQFGKRKDSKDGKDIYCKKCKNNISKIWQQNNIDKVKEIKNKSDKHWYAKNKQHKLNTNNAWKQANTEHVKKWYRLYKSEREAKDPAFRLANKLRNRLWYALKGKRKICKFDEYIGCSKEYLKKHIESLFEPEMTWDNYGKEWDVDHIEPLCSFDLTDKQQLLIACNYKILQPIYKKKHKIKTTKDLKKSLNKKFI